MNTVGKFFLEVWNLQSQPFGMHHCLHCSEGDEGVTTINIYICVVRDDKREL